MGNLTWEDMLKGFYKRGKQRIGRILRFVQFMAKWNALFVVIMLIELGMENGGKEDIHPRSVLGFSLRGGFERGKGDFLVIFGEGVCV